MNWLHIGTSPSVLTYLTRARWENRIDKTITCNAGILLEPKPDYYFAVDMVANARFDTPARAAQAAGTHLVTLKRELSALQQRHCEWYNEFLELPASGMPTRERYGAFQYTGPLCMEYAIRHGATTLILVGCDGYTGKNDYFDGWAHDSEDPPGIYQRMTVEVLQPRIQHLVSLWPDVQWRVYGRPVYPIVGANWRVIGTGLGSLADGA